MAVTLDEVIELAHKFRHRRQEQLEIQDEARASGQSNAGRFDRTYVDFTTSFLKDVRKGLVVMPRVYTRSLIDPSKSNPQFFEEYRAFPSDEQRERAEYLLGYLEFNNFDIDLPFVEGVNQLYEALMPEAKTTFEEALKIRRMSKDTRTSVIRPRNTRVTRGGVSYNPESNFFKLTHLAMRWYNRKIGRIKKKNPSVVNNFVDAYSESARCFLGHIISNEPVYGAGLVSYAARVTTNLDHTDLHNSGRISFSLMHSLVVVQSRVAEIRKEQGLEPVSFSTPTFYSEAGNSVDATIYRLEVNK